MAVNTEIAARLIDRYRDSYRVAHAVVAVGTAIKTVAALVAMLTAIVTIAISTSLANQVGALAGAMAVIGIAAAVMIGLIGWVLGVLVNSSGQMQLATLDGAVNTCPLIGDDARIDIMGLSPAGAAPVRAGVTARTNGGLQLLPDGKAKCWKCGKGNAIDQDNCWSCYTPLRRAGA